ncbi:MAG: hypothetical protein IKZ84_11740, partial [Victivallales bacterium]|nr:hypothetical protein [Victivallales bacterium]
EPRKARKSTKIQSTEYTEQTEKPRRRADDIFRNQRRNKALVANDANGSGSSAVLKALRATEKPHEKSLSKNKKMNDSSMKNRVYL